MLAGVVLIAQMAVPLVSLVALAVAEPGLAGTLRAAGGEIAYSLGVAGAAALASLPIALVLGPAMARPGSIEIRGTATPPMRHSRSTISAIPTARFLGVRGSCSLV